MAQTITNQASLRYQYGEVQASTLSNVATATLTQALTVTKTPLTGTYRAGDVITYVVSVVNGGASALSDVAVTDDLGAYAAAGGTAVPLTFADGALLILDGVPGGTLTPTAADGGVTFTIPSLAAGADAQLVYTAAVNGFAPLEAAGAITNTVTVTAAGTTESASATATITVEDYADVTVTKTMSPASVRDGEPITYTFAVTNCGNTEATGLTLTDAFAPAPASVAVTVDGASRATAEYTYTGGVLTLPSAAGAPLSLPAAEITQDPATGAVTVTPSSMTITVVGTF